MAKCSDCNKEMKGSNSCDKPYLEIDGKKRKRDTKVRSKSANCHDCSIENKEGNIHHLLCDMEICPKCGGQLITCGCKKSSIPTAT